MRPTAKIQTTTALGGSKSGHCPDLIANNRSRDGGSSAAASPRQQLPLPHNSNATSALDATGSAPIPPPQATQPLQRCHLLTARAVADMLNVCPETVLRWIRNGELPAVRLPGGAIRINESNLHDWLRARATPARGVLATTAGAAGSTRYLGEYD
jgi:excisionase family DNA binding protein